VIQIPSEESPRKIFQPRNERRIDAVSGDIEKTGVATRATDFRRRAACVSTRTKRCNIDDGNARRAND
jgi:hypothetical protein